MRLGAGMGLLDDATFEEVTKDLHGVSNIQVYREFKPMHDRLEFTIFLMDDEFEKKRRVDYSVPGRDMERSDANTFLIDVARIFITHEVSRQRVADRVAAAEEGRLDKHGRIIK